MKFGIFEIKLFQAALVVTLILRLCIPARAQVAAGMLRGTVTDSSGASAPSCHVAAKNVNTGVKSTTSTNEAGSYAFPNLLPGSYEVSASAQGFGDQTKSGVTIDVGAEVVIDFALSVAEQNTTLQVAAQAVLLQTTTPEVAGLTDSATISELPLNGRSWTDLALLEPGVTSIRTQGNPPSSRGPQNGFGNQVTISGSRPAMNNYLIDGISMNDYSNAAPGSVLGGNLGVDAVAEYTVVTSNPSAEYSNTAGGVMTATTRSGTNTFHGDMYEFLRNSALDARNFFDASTLPPFKRNQFGAALGGPIRRNRTFFFVNYEGIRQSKGTTSIATVPTQDARDGIIHNADGTATKLTVDPAAAKYLVFWPLPNAGLAPKGLGNTGLFNFVIQEVVSEDFVIARMDHRFSDGDSIFGTYMYDRTPDNLPDALDTLLTENLTARQVASLNENHIFSPAIVNSLRVGLNREWITSAVPAQPLNPAAKDASFGAEPGQNAAKVSISGVTGFGGGYNSAGTLAAWTTVQVHDDLFWNRGQHAIKAGFYAELEQYNENSLKNLTGNFTFGSLTAFLTNGPSRFEGTLPGLNGVRGLRDNIYGGYVQDSWRVNSNFTINLGLRYEMSTVPTEVQGKLAALAYVSAPAPHLGNHLFNNPTLTNFEPRVGFAWSDPLHIQKTVVRSAFGIYDVLPLAHEIYRAVTDAAPFYGFGEFNAPAGSFYTGALGDLTPESLREAYIQQNPKRDYVMQWNFTVQRELATALVATAAYAGSRGVHNITASDEWDVVIPASTSAGYVWPVPIGSGTVINPNFGNIRGVAWESSSIYHALQLGLRKNFTHGLQFQAAYTWSKSIDNSTETNNGSPFLGPWWNLKLLRGLSDFNVPRLLVLSGFWQVPGARSPSKALNWVAGGWQVGGILQASGGTPFTAQFGSDPLGSNGEFFDDPPDRLTGPGCSALTSPGNASSFIKTQCFGPPVAPSQAFYSQYCSPTFSYPTCINLLGNAGRNILQGPSLVNFDLSVFKNIRIPGAGERFSMQFRAEMFNVFNHPSFHAPSGQIFDANGALTNNGSQLTSTVTDSREIQFGLKVRW